MLPGQVPDDWSKVAPRLAQTFGARSVRVRKVKGSARALDLLVRRRPSRHGATPDMTETEDTSEPVTVELPAADESPVERPRGAFPKAPRGRS
jgi:hypothetical protein